MPADVGKKKTAIERFFEWATGQTDKKADEVYTEVEKLARGNKDKEEALKELDEEYGAQPTPEPTPEPTPTKKKPKPDVFLK